MVLYGRFAADKSFFYWQNRYWETLYLQHNNIGNLKVLAKTNQLLLLKFSINRFPRECEIDLTFFSCNNKTIKQQIHSGERVLEEQGSSSDFPSRATILSAILRYKEAHPLHFPRGSQNVVSTFFACVFLIKQIWVCFLNNVLSCISQHNTPQSSFCCLLRACFKRKATGHALKNNEQIKMLIGSKQAVQTESDLLLRALEWLSGEKAICC